MAEDQQADASTKPAKHAAKKSHCLIIAAVALLMTDFSRAANVAMKI